jgi:hypothetical protein
MRVFVQGDEVLAQKNQASTTEPTALFRLSLISVCLLSALPLSLSAKDLGAYQLGDIAEQDIVATAPLTVTDDAATREIREREAGRVPLHLRYYIKSADDAEAELRRAFFVARTNFLEALDAAYPEHALTLTPDDVASRRFKEMAASSQKQTGGFPVPSDLAELWALGLQDGVFLEPLAARLREAMSHPIRSADPLPPELKPESVVRLVPLDSTNDIPKPQLASEHGTELFSTNLAPLARAREELQDSFPPDQRALGVFLASLLRPNCLVDRQLTLQLRESQTAGLVVQDHYAAGQVLVRKGQAIDAKALAALAQLREATAADTGAKPASPALAGVQAGRLSGPEWIVAIMAGLALVVAVLALRVAGRARALSLLPARIESGPLEAGASGPLTPEEMWRQRALRAELQVDKAREAARAGLLSHMARSLSNAFAQRLIASRSELVESQHKAAADMERIEDRIEVLHARMKDRVASYEKRIAELERELSSQTEASRELIKAEIKVIQRQLQVERARREIEFN